MDIMGDFLKVVIGVVMTAVVGGIVVFVKKRVSIKSKAEQEVDVVKTELECAKGDVNELKKAVPVIMQCLLALLMAAKDGKVNGECDKALDSLNMYLILK